MAEPYADAASHLRDELRRVWLRVEYQIRRGWARGTVARAADDDGPLVWKPGDVGRLFEVAQGDGARATADDSGAAEVLERWLALHRSIDARVAATRNTRTRIPLLELARAFELSPRQWATLMFAVMPEIDPNLIAAYRYLARDPSCRGIDGRLLAELVYDTPERRALLARDLAPSSPLMFYRLLEAPTATGQQDSLLFRRLRPATRLVHLLDGARLELDPELAEYAVVRTGGADGTFSTAALATASAALRTGDVLLAVQGQRGVGKKLLLQIAAAQWGRGLLLIDGRRLGELPAATQNATVRALLREAILLDAVPAVPDVDDIVAGAMETGELPPFVGALLADWRGAFAITVSRERMPRINQRPLVHLALEVPTTPTRVALWRRAMPALPEPEATALADKFAIPGGVIVAAAQAATASQLPGQPPPDSPHLIRAVSEQLHQRIQRLGKKLATPYDMTDLVVDDDVREALVEIVAAVKERHTVREQWGLRGAHGISVLFSGHPGVGKTMAGTVLARRLGLDIYEVDLSQVVSKWLGESEKNLSDLFDAAEPGHVVLLFNEADSLFGKRTVDVKSSNDRYANLETNYLLQRLERFNGLAILTTNMSGAIDQAFKRRFSYDVFFSFPSPDMRAELWQRTLPAAARAPDIDFDGLAERFELTGGFIKVACERAAYLANSGGTRITEPLLRHTIERMYRERGKLSAVGPLE